MRSIHVEQFHPSQGLSFDISVYESLFSNKSQNIFKVHEDYELTAIFNCSGKRIVGNNISNFTNGDLFLLGPNLPHSVLVDNPKESNAICIHFKEDSFGTDFFKKPQNSDILDMLKNGALGCHFFGNEADLIAKELKQLPALDPFYKMLNLLDILYQLSKTSKYKLLCSPEYKPIVKTKDARRISLIYDYIIENFNRKLSVEELAELIHVSPSTFSRQFKKSMNKNFSEFIAEVRIGHACKLLLNSDMDISEICYRSGYQQITHFNRQFRNLMNVTPSNYRKAQFNS